MVIKSLSEKETINFAEKLAKICAEYPQLMIYLQGSLGAGKTTFARGFIKYFGFDKVKSPTYALVESYTNEKIKIHHFDLYRLSEAEELEYIGIREYINNICLIEWAKKGAGILPGEDLLIDFSSGDNKNIELNAKTNLGLEILSKC